MHRSVQRRRRSSHDLLPRPLRRCPGTGSGAVSPAPPRRQNIRARQRRHEGRAGQHALRSARGAGARTARRPSDRAAFRLRRRDRQRGRLGIPPPGPPDRPRGGSDAHRRADRWRDLARVPGRDNPPSRDCRPRSPRRLRPRGRQRIRAHDPHRRAAHRTVPPAARPTNELPGRKRGGRGLHARRRWTGWCGRRLQRRPRIGVVLDRPSLQSGGRAGARAGTA